MDRISIKSTLPSIPLPRSSIPTSIPTPRLTLRPYRADDLASLCALRSQPQVMMTSPRGKPEPADLTRKFLQVRLEQQEKEENDGRLEYVVCERETGEVMGFCGIQHNTGYGMGWPSLGYQMRSEVWGRGYATEAVRAVMATWWALERSERDVTVDSSTITAISTDDENEEKEVHIHKGGKRGRECVAAITTEENVASRRVLEKCGFAMEKVWEDQDLRDVSSMVRLVGYVAHAP